MMIQHAERLVFPRFTSSAPRRPRALRLAVLLVADVRSQTRDVASKS